MQHVMVGLSGGVDSAVSAARLRDAGYGVTGVFIKIWQPEFIECTWQKDRLDAIRVAVALNIPFLEVDLSDAYKREVIDDMIAQYQHGATPNPDVRCNEKIKFGAFAAWAFAHGADMVATGHYAQVQNVDGTPSLLQGVDPTKDQSYFLYRIEPAVLAKTIFPVGNSRKAAIRAEAEARALPVAQKSDSQGLCFVGDVSMQDFLGRYISPTPGSVVNSDGDAIGVHEGTSFYTIGQRHGFSISVANPEHKPWYVVDIDPISNRIVASTDRTLAAHAETKISNLHWLASPQARVLHAMVRYRSSLVPIEIEERSDGAYVKFATPQIVSPGQALVCYESNRVIGGGIMERTACA